MKRMILLWLIAFLLATLPHLAVAQASGADQRLAPMSQGERMCYCVFRSGGQSRDGGAMTVRQCAERGGICVMMPRGRQSRMQDR
jgi:hypothetical protein